MPDLNLFYQLLAGFLALLSSSIGNPTPEEVMLIGFGVQAGLLSGDYPGWSLLMLPAVLLGAVVTDVILYGIGRLIGTHAGESAFMKRLSPPEKRERIRENFHRYGFWIFAFGRLVPGIRTTLFLSAGTMKIDFKRFLLADGVGALIGGSLFFFLGYGLGSQFERQFRDVEERISPYKAWFIIFLVIAILLYVTYKFLRNPIPTGDPKDVPLIGKQIAAVLPKPPAEKTAAPGEANLNVPVPPPEPQAGTPAPPTHPEAQRTEPAPPPTPQAEAAPQSPG